MGITSKAGRNPGFVFLRITALPPPVPQGGSEEGLRSRASFLQRPGEKHVRTSENDKPDGRIFGDPIHTYSRTQAIEDGFLVDLMQDEMLEVCRQHYKFPIACTSAVFGIMQAAVENPRYCNDYAGVLHDMLHMSKVCKRQVDEATVMFKVIIMGAGRQRNFVFKLQVGPGDEGESVVTIMRPNED